MSRRHRRRRWYSSCVAVCSYAVCGRRARKWNSAVPRTPHFSDFMCMFEVESILQSSIDYGEHDILNTTHD
jgi:hypothetical protein